MDYVYNERGYNAKHKNNLRMSGEGPEYSAR